MKLKYIYIQLLLLLILVNNTYAQSPIVVNKSTSANDNSEHGFSTYCGSDNDSEIYFYLHIEEDIELIHTDLSLLDINNSIASASLDYDGSLSGTLTDIESNNYNGKRTKSIPGRKLVAGRYRMTITLDQEIERSQVTGNYGRFDVNMFLRFEVGNERKEHLYSVGYCEKTPGIPRRPRNIPTTASSASFKISVIANHNKTIIEFDINDNATNVNIDAISLINPGQRESIISNQAFAKGSHKILIDNARLPKGVSQILLQRNQEISSQKTIRL